MDCLKRTALLGQIGKRHGRLQTHAQTFGAHGFGDHLVGLARKLSCLCLGDDRQLFYFQVGQGLHRPLVGSASVWVNAIRNELLPHAQHLDRRVLETAERLSGSVHQQTLGSVADANCGCVAQQPFRQTLNLNCDVFGLQHIDVDADHLTCGDANACLGPVAPDVDFVLSRVALTVAAPLGIVLPGTQAKHARLFSAGLDRQNGVAAIYECGPKLGHVIVWIHAFLQNGGSSA